MHVDIAPYVTNTSGPVFALLRLPEEVIAVLFAKYSRGTKGLRETLAELLAEEDIGDANLKAPDFAHAAEKARAFHEKYVVGYGHGSVAEHAVVHLGIEGVSILGAKAIEDARLASFTEKSTRYVVFDRNAFVTPKEIVSDDMRSAYQASCNRLFDTYLGMMPVLQRALAEQNPDATEAAVKAAVLDTLRGLLPASTKTNLGLTANARTLEWLLTKMYSTPILEVVNRGFDMVTEAEKVVPTLLRHVDRSLFRRDAWTTAQKAGIFTRREELAQSKHGVRIVRFQFDAQDRVVLALIQELDGIDPAAGVAEALLGSSPTAAAEIIHDVMKKRGKHDPPPRAFEHAHITVELTLDYGAWRDLQRHRMLSATTPRLTCLLGYEVPALVKDLGLGERYALAMDQAAEVWSGMADSNPWAAQYAVPLGYRVRTLWTMNLREVFHVIELRSKREGHPSYRRIAQDLHREVTTAMPWLNGLIRCDENTYALARK